MKKLFGIIGGLIAAALLVGFIYKDLASGNWVDNAVMPLVLLKTIRAPSQLLQTR